MRFSSRLNSFFPECLLLQARIVFFKRRNCRAVSVLVAVLDPLPNPTIYRAWISIARDFPKTATCENHCIVGGVLSLCRLFPAFGDGRDLILCLYGLLLMPMAQWLCGFLFCEAIWFSMPSKPWNNKKSFYKYSFIYLACLTLIKCLGFESSLNGLRIFFLGLPGCLLLWQLSLACLKLLIHAAKLKMAWKSKHDE